MGYCDHAEAELIALTRQKRREEAVRRLKAKYGETVHACGPTVEFVPTISEPDPPKTNRRWRRLPVTTLDRALRRHTKKEERRNRPVAKHVMRPEGPHTNYLSQAAFEKIRRFQGNACYLCRREFTPDDDATQDHVVPRSKGGKNAGNILLAHAWCNTKKADRDPTADELAYLAEIRMKFVADPRMPPDPNSNESRKKAEFAKAMDRAKRARLGFWRYWWRRLKAAL